MTDIFISYRRQDSADIAKKIYNSLAKVYGKERIYLDVHNNKPGAIFPEEIRQALNRAKVILVIIGQQWVDIADEKGKRLFDENDFVRKEVSHALERHNISATLIPVLVNNAKMPSKDQLPPLLEQLANIQGQSIGKNYQALLNPINDALNLYNQIPTPPPSHRPQSAKKGILNKFINQSRIAIIIEVLVGIIFVGIIIPFIPQELKDSVWYTIFPQNRPADENAVQPLFVSNETFSVDAVAKDPTGLLIAPSRAGLALWGYSDAESTLFALDITTGRAVEIWDAPSDQDGTQYPLSTLYDRAVITALHYDGQWLWVGDSRNNRLIAFNPLSLESEINIYEFGDTGDPTIILNIQNTLWVALRDSQELVSLSVNHANNRIQPNCRVTLSGIPRIVTPYPASAILVATENTNTLTQIDEQSCNPIVRSIAVEPKALLFFNNKHYVMAENGLYQILDGGKLQPINIPLNNNDTVQLATSQNQLIWFTTTSNQLLAFDIETERIVYETTLDNSPTNIISSDTQVWFVNHPNQITRYIIPHQIYPNGQYLVAYQETVWVLDDKPQLCHINNPADCKPINISNSRISAVSSNIDQDSLWIGTESGELWSIRLETHEATLINQVVSSNTPVITPIRNIAQASNRYLWVRNDIDNLIRVDLDTGELSYPLDNTQTLRPPDYIAFEDNRLWFVYYNPRGISVTEAILNNDIIRTEPTLMTIANTQSVNTQSVLKAYNNRLYLGALGGLYIYDMAGNNLATIGVDNNISDIVIIDGRIWILNRKNGFVFSFLGN